MKVMPGSRVCIVGLTLLLQVWDSAEGNEMRPTAEEGVMRDTVSSARRALTGAGANTCVDDDVGLQNDVNQSDWSCAWYQDNANECHEMAHSSSQQPHSAFCPVTCGTCPAEDAPPSPACVDDVDCGNNGSCDSGACSCTNDFTGPNCQCDPNHTFCPSCTHAACEWDCDSGYKACESTPSGDKCDFSYCLYNNGNTQGSSLDMDEITWILSDITDNPTKQPTTPPTRQPTDPPTRQSQRAKVAARQRGGSKPGEDDTSIFTALGLNNMADAVEYGIHAAGCAEDDTVTLDYGEDCQECEPCNCDTDDYLSITAASDDYSDGFDPANDPEYADSSSSQECPEQQACTINECKEIIRCAKCECAPVFCPGPVETSARERQTNCDSEVAKVAEKNDKQMIENKKLREDIQKLQEQAARTSGIKECDCDYVGATTELNVGVLCQQDHICYNLIENWCGDTEYYCQVPFYD